MDTEGEEVAFIKERPRRTRASQVWRIWPLFELFLDNLALVWLFCGDFQSCLEIFSPLWRFSVIFFGDFQSIFVWRFSVDFLEIFSKVYGDFQSIFLRFSVVV